MTTIEPFADIPFVSTLLPIPEQFADENEYLKFLAFEGLTKRLPEKAQDSEYVSRLEQEIDKFIEDGSALQWINFCDISVWADKNNLSITTNRASVHSYLTAFCFYLTDNDPIQISKMFDVFLTKGNETVREHDDF